MTEQIALKILNSETENISDVQVALKVARDALAEIQQYRAIGTVEEIKSYFNENRKAGYKHGYSDGYNKAIEEFAERLKNKLVARYGNAKPTQQYMAMQVIDWCNEIAESMKGNKNEH